MILWLFFSSPIKKLQMHMNNIGQLNDMDPKCTKLQLKKSFWKKSYFREAVDIVWKVSHCFTLKRPVWRSDFLPHTHTYPEVHK